MKAERTATESMTVTISRVGLVPAILSIVLPTVAARPVCSTPPPMTIGWFEQAADHQCDDDDQCHHVHAQPFGDEEKYGEEQNAQCEIHLKCHGCILHDRYFFVIL